MESAFDKITKDLDWSDIWNSIDSDGINSISCDDAESYLCVTPSCDGDFHLWLTPHEGAIKIGHPSFRARTYMGGGNNSRVRTALALLALAIVEDTKEHNKYGDTDG